MYNEERKNQFIEQYTVKDTNNTVRALFQSLEPFEEKFGKDVSEMSQSELQETVDSVLAVKTISKYSRLRYIFNYIKWCSVHGFPNVTDAINRLNTTGIEKMRKQYVASPMHLQRCLDLTYDSVADNTADLIYRGYLWLAYMEFPEKRIAELTKDNIQFNKHRLVFDGRSYILYSEAEETFRKLAELTAFFYRHNNPYYESIRDRYLGNGLLRGIKGDFDSAWVRSKSYARIAQSVNDNGIPRISYKRLTSSGMFYRIYERERAGIIKTNLFQEFYEVFADHSIEPRSAAVMAHAYVNDYERWKLSFFV